ncbi:hypothetical protein [Micromonospora mirobrigensis]|uniref:Uncharacterized protein n=1 Tax=Micromonospora mirobrigensis TaxID=262898 RepID=A0A1C4YPD2_9ACTN|nr:hypothetical protein [Micromonospora mirobrigensis]SCF22556.1 hypothetical protein GA0070564_104258 [Micromonospora mirobrigensis]
MPFTPKVELYLGSTSGWADITADVRQADGIRIRRGRSAEGKVADPSTCSMVLDNRAGKYSPRNPASPYYGKLGRNTPIRVRVAEVDPSRAVAVPGTATVEPVTAPGTLALGGAGDLDVRFQGRHHAGWFGGDRWIMLAARFEPTGNQRCWYFGVVPGGYLGFVWYTDGGSTFGFAQSTVPIVAEASGELTVNVELDVDNGAGGWSVRFYQARTMAGPWQQVGATRTGAGVTSVFNSASTPLNVGWEHNVNAQPFVGDLIALQVRVGGTLVTSPNFASMSLGTSTLTDAQGRVYTLSSEARVIDRGARFYGEVSSWPVRWSPTGADRWVPITAAGVTRRLAQGKTPLRSPLYRTLVAAKPTAYLPLEDGPSSTRPSSAAAGVSAGRSSGVEFGVTSNRLAGATTTARFTAPDGYLGSSVVHRPSATVWSVLTFFRLSSAPTGADTVFLRIYCAGGRVARWDWLVGNGVYRWIGYDIDGVVVDNRVLTNSVAPPTSWSLMYFEVVRSGSSTTWKPVFANAGSPTYYTDPSAPYTITGLPGYPTRIDVLSSTYLDGSQWSHLAVDDQKLLTVGDLTALSSAYAGELAGRRMARVAAEAGVELVIDGLADDTIPLGPQPVGTALDVIRDAAAADMGILQERRGALALSYRPRSSLYNRPALALPYDGGYLTEPLEPVDDDDAVRNDITVSRPDGASVRAVRTSGPLSIADPPAGVGVYDTSETVNVASDALLDDVAGWLLLLGTVDDARWPRIGVQLAGPAWPVDTDRRATAVALDAGDVVALTNLPDWVPGGVARAMVQGYDEQIGQYTWSIVWNATPADPWTVAITNGPQRAGATGASLATAVTAASATLSLTATESGALWTTNPLDFPLDLRVGEEQVTVSAITGTASPQTATVAARGVNGPAMAWPVGTDVDVWTPAVVPL